jgi:hypothetical protein
MNLHQIQSELQKRHQYPYVWGTKQQDAMDQSTNFIYRISNFDELVEKLEQMLKYHPDRQQIFNYALNRWYNFWSARAVEEIFCSHPIVKPLSNPKDKRADFKINEIWFDHKTTVCPIEYINKIQVIKEIRKDLIEWLYNNQSQQQRKHYYNRLFIFLFDPHGEHWKLKAEIFWLKDLIYSYLDSFDKSNLLSFSFVENKLTYSDVIWAIKS